MAKPEKMYTRLTRNASGVGSYSSLWLAADHLMIVKSTGYTESYARLLLRDVQAFFVVKTDRRMWWSLWWGAVALVSGIVAGVNYNNDDTPVVSAIIFSLGLALLIWNEVLGSSVRVMVVTGVQTIPLPALVRRKKARRVLGRLQPLIEAAQTDLRVVPPAPSEASPLMQPSPSAPEGAAPAVTEQPVKPENPAGTDEKITDPGVS